MAKRIKALTISDIIRGVGIDPGAFIEEGHKENSYVRLVQNGKLPLGEEYPVPIERRVGAFAEIADMEIVQRHEAELKLKIERELASALAHEIHKHKIPIETEVDVLRRTTQYRQEIYVFTHEQMIAFIREVQDATKESMAE